MTEHGPLSGQTLGGKYLLGEILGKGGCGAVYKAKHILLNRDQAVKVIKDNVVDSDRFKREAQILANLVHPNILHVDDFGIEDERPYIVMPFIAGGTLKTLIFPNGLSLEQTSTSLKQICDALDFAHTNNIVHLDLKPDNILYQNGMLLLSDFGLAHPVNEDAVIGGSSLKVGMGTPSYGAPEQFSGKPQRASDIYALGATLFCILTGRSPFEGSTPFAILKKQLEELPPSVHAIKPNIPLSIDDVIRYAMAKEPGNRYPSPGALFNDFKARAGLSLPPTIQPIITPNRPAQTPPNPHPRQTQPQYHRTVETTGTLFINTITPHAQVQLDAPPPLDVMNRLLQEIGKEIQ